MRKSRTHAREHRNHKKRQGRGRAGALQMWCSILEPIWNPKNKKPSVIFPKPLIFWCLQGDSNSRPTDYKLVTLPVEMVHLPFSKGKVSIKAAMNAAISYFPLTLISSNTGIAYCFNLLLFGCGGRI